ncbi:MAG TPA: efflux RND transporter periplasmic adaptor subunit [Terriglobia bacterium]
MKRSGVLLLFVTCVALAAATCGDAQDSSRTSAAPSPTSASLAQTAPARTPATPPKSEAQKPRKEEPQGLEILSVLSVEQEVDVLAKRSGLVESAPADQGASVQKGSVLARLDDRELLAQLDKAKADLAIAESNVKYNEAELKAREAAYRRAQEMRKAGLNSDADLEEAEFRAKGSQHDLEAWRATVDKQKAEIRMIELEVEKTLVRAPFAGVVVRRYVRVGQDVLKDDKCFRLSQLSPLLVRFLVPETSPRRPRAGDTVTLVPASGSRQKCTARIQKFSPVVDAASGSYEVTAQLTGPNLAGLRPGMAVRVLWK